jgi:hypothetical protein
MDEKKEVSLGDLTPKVRITDEDIAKLDGTEKLRCRANSLPRQRLDKLFRMFCVYSLSPREVVGDGWRDCKSCILHEVSWLAKQPKQPGQERVVNLCYAYWHEGILNG